MERQELQARLRELHSRAERRGTVGCTGFLTPAEQQWAMADCRQAGLDGLILWGGPQQSERKMAFFFPSWADPESYPYDEAAGVHLTARFGAPTHRDVLGSVLALGVERHAIGDIAVMGEEVWFIALTPVARLQHRVWSASAGPVCAPSSRRGKACPHPSLRRGRCALQSRACGSTRRYPGFFSCRGPRRRAPWPGGGFRSIIWSVSGPTPESQRAMLSLCAVREKDEFAPATALRERGVSPSKRNAGFSEILLHLYSIITHFL